MLRWHIVLLIAIRPSDGLVKPGGPLDAFREEQAMSRHRVSPSPFLSSSQHNHTTQTVTHTVTLTSTSYSTLYRYSSHTKHRLPKRCVIRKQTTVNAIYPPCVEPEAHNIAVGWHWNSHTHTHTHTHAHTHTHTHTHSPCWCPQSWQLSNSSLSCDTSVASTFYPTFIGYVFQFCPQLVYMISLFRLPFSRSSCHLGITESPLQSE